MISTFRWLEGKYTVMTSLGRTTPAEPEQSLMNIRENFKTLCRSFFYMIQKDIVQIEHINEWNAAYRDLDDLMIRRFSLILIN